SFGSAEIGDQGSAEFKSIYEALLKRVALPGADKDRYRTLLDLWRETRNAAHNNMVFYPASGNPRVISYRDEVYRFDIDQPLAFVEWKLLLLITCDLGSMLEEIIRTPEVASLSTIYDPANLDLHR